MTAAGMCRGTPQKGPLSPLLVGHATIPNAPRMARGPQAPKTTPEDGATTPIARLTGEDRGGRVIVRPGGLTLLLYPAGALQRGKPSGAPGRHRIGTE